MNRRVLKQIEFTIVAVVLSALIFWFIRMPYAAPFITVQVAAQACLGLFWVGYLAYTLSLLGNASITFALAASVAVLTALIGAGDIWAVGAGCVVLLIILSASRSIHSEVSDRIKYRTSRIYYRGTELLIFGFILTVAGLKLGSLSADVQQGALRVPERHVERLSQALEPVLTNILPGFSSDATIEELLQQQVTTTGSRPLSEQELQAATQELGGYIQAPIEPRQDLSSVLSSTINKYLENISRTYPFTATLLALVAIIFTARLLLPVLVWPALGVVILLHLILTTMGITYVLQSREMVERLEI